ncbi:hypothetical protein [Candidatus Reidiella endopervernicosa]|uniref:Response regulatory domain-containing protein n=1 Tax=Candidatus Reidiella endopervernicosa TaxID=2738883 RepID=A0A6N0HYC1_9GAMM|nr:hypothetical protein [Candidatus Reidiella endopervernicosa]QKQ27368.1 hypothetical protein HUE57_14585 [Candidatus Reidiella endopervernicosa]
MPVMDGYRATEAIRQAPGFSDLPIIAMTDTLWSVTGRSVSLPV